MGVCKLPQGVGKEMMMRGRLMQQQQKLVRRGKQGKERSQIRFTPIPCFFEGFHVLGRLSAISDAEGVSMGFNLVSILRGCGVFVCNCRCFGDEKWVCDHVFRWSLECRERSCSHPQDHRRDCTWPRTGQRTVFPPSPFPSAWFHYA